MPDSRSQGSQEKKTFSVPHRSSHNWKGNLPIVLSNFHSNRSQNRSQNDFLKITKIPQHPKNEKYRMPPLSMKNGFFRRTEAGEALPHSFLCVGSPCRDTTCRKTSRFGLRFGRSGHERGNQRGEHDHRLESQRRAFHFWLRKTSSSNVRIPRSSLGENARSSHATCQRWAKTTRQRSRHR